jgi:hypothetical protein
MMKAIKQQLDAVEEPDMNRQMGRLQKTFQKLSELEDPANSEPYNHGIVLEVIGDLGRQTKKVVKTFSEEKPSNKCLEHLKRMLKTFEQFQIDSA